VTISLRPKLESMLLHRVDCSGIEDSPKLLQVLLVKFVKMWSNVVDRCRLFGIRFPIIYKKANTLDENIIHAC
jgi:hypothetical protein